MRIIFTKHALGKFQHPSVIKLGITRRHVKLALTSPDYSGKIEERNVEFILKGIDVEHDLRVIFRKKGAIILVVTFYPTEKGRYKQSL